MLKMHWRPGHDAPPVPDLLVGGGGDTSPNAPPPSAPSALRSSCPREKPGAPCWFTAGNGPAYHSPSSQF